jgi:glycosyltransferase involved in cell wall biosynthesis
MESTFNDAWVQVVPSICPEPFGVVISEAMMRGTPVIASRIGGMKEVVREGETGFLAAPGDSENLAQVLLHLLRKRNLAEGMGMAARAFALEHLSMRTFVDQIEAAYATAREKFQRRTC